jgi:acetyl esterase/lipase
LGILTKRPAVFVIPGGGYTHCSPREADPVAFAFLKAGYQAFILRYTCQQDGTWPLPLEDYQKQLMKILTNTLCRMEN